MERGIQYQFDGSSSSTSDATPPEQEDLTTSRQNSSSPELGPALWAFQDLDQSMMQDYDLDAPIEKLPAELRDYILSLLDLGELKALVLASPVYHAHYLSDRRHILARCFDATLKTAAVDAEFAYKSASIEFAQKRNTESVETLVNDYYKWRQESVFQCSILKGNPTTEDMANMVEFHLGVVQPLMKLYIDEIFSNLTQQPEVNQCDRTLSPTEEIRVLRSMYRFQLGCNLFGAGPNFTYSKPCLPDDMEGTLSFLFRPWELEEINCINVFAKVNYDHIFDRNVCDMGGDHLQINDASSLGWEDLGALYDDLYSRYCLINGTVSCGLELLHAALFLFKKHDDLVSTLRKYIKPGHSYFLDMRISVQQQGPLCYASIKHRGVEHWSPLPFQGDLMVPNAQEQYPPMAWILIWKGEWSNLRGVSIPDELRLWGYVLWDAARFETTGAKEVLTRQCKMKWGR
ncbi:hypothetical protein ASPBRDRAFT_678288 [Aspergillus brasiliensis CBS 101740]|uniref:F-box domain-containing protein n=1 Tax=Aspergillus brasiliensis (strain CBS 101740 / IMI 381727 / IBT 21946) TaxID=767769 RepID=A0A1L9UE23_ASPBC|nr:hypothetical protein ASPBRDRAFT_678288 [Aspergillus brasiliensis CBS 101740]